MPPSPVRAYLSPNVSESPCGVSVTRYVEPSSGPVKPRLTNIEMQDSWVHSTFPTFDAPLLFDNNYSKKPAYAGVDSALN